MGDINQLCQGIINNSGTVEAGVNTAVRAQAVVTNNGGQDGQYYVCTSLAQIYSALGIGGNLGAYFPLASIRARWGFVQQAQFTDSQVVLLLRVRRYREISAESPQLEAGLQYFNYKGHYPTDYQQWVGMYGNEWVSDILVGGEFLASYRCVATGGSSNESVVAALTGNGLVGAGLLSGDVAGAFQKARAAASFDVAASYHVTGVSSVPYIEPAAFWDYAARFGAVNLDAQQILHFTPSSYEVVGVKEVRPGWM